MKPTARIIAIAAAILLAAVAVGIGVWRYRPAKVPPIEDTLAASLASTTTIASTTATAPNTTQAVAPMPSALDALLQTQGLSADELTAADCTQLVTVDSRGEHVTICFYEYSARGWREREELRCGGYVGINGVEADRKEGSGTTPAGLYGIGEAFYIGTPPATALPAFAVTTDTYWVDDPYSAYYNHRVEGTAAKDWTSAEHMIDYPDNYRYGFVVEYNTAGTFGLGSAIFFHVGDNATVGCIATSEAMVLNYLAVLDPACNPHIFIG